MTGVYEMSVRGDVDLLDAIQEIAVDMADKIAPAGLRGYMQVVSKAVKAEFPSHMKDAKKSIGYKVRKVNPRTGEVDAKVGAKVGMKKGKVQQLGNESANKRNAGKKRPGVGISAQNIQWYLTGTKRRNRKTAGGDGDTGKMPAEDVVKRGYAKSKHQALAKFRENVQKDMLKRVKKQRRKARGRISKSIIKSGKRAAFGGLI